MAKKNYTCPYCFYKFKKNEFDLKPSSNGRTVYKHCPNPDADKDGKRICNRYLPPDFADHDAKTVAIYGGTNAGKSTYIASAFKVLLDNNNVSNYLKLDAAYLEEDDYSEEIVDEYWHKMVFDKQFPDFSSSADSRLKRPIVLSVQNITNNKKTYLTFFDTPGGEFEEMKNIVENYPYIYNADSILFFLDPLQIKSMLSLILENDKISGKLRFSKYKPFDRINVKKTVRNLSSAIREAKESNGYLANQNNTSEEEVENYTFLKEDNNIKDIFEEYWGALKKNLPGNRAVDFKVTIPTAFCISKYDLLAGSGNVHGFNNIIYSDDEFFIAETPPNNWISFIIDRINEDSKTIHDFLNANESRLFREIDSKFSTYKVFGVAAAFADDDNLNIVKINEGKPVTKNLLHPLIWVLNELKFFK